MAIDLYLSLSYIYSNDVVFQISLFTVEAMTMTKIHKDIAIFMVQLTQRKDITERDIIYNINQRTKELIRNIRASAAQDEVSEATQYQLKKNDNTSPLDAFLFSLAQAENLPVNKI